MKITALVENKTEGNLKAKHGLSLYIETNKHKLLFDLGPDNTLFENSKKLDIDLSKVDVVILSHGHMDHGGGLKQFLKINKTAKIYAQRKAFDKHYNKLLLPKVDISVPSDLKTNPQLILLDGDFKIDDELMLFAVENANKYYSSANDSLFTETEKDDFSHEQNLMIFNESNVLVMGCGHTGVVNIMEKAKQYNPNVCVGGYHLFNPLTKRTVTSKLLDGIAEELAKYDTHYYTCHCTGEKAYNYLADKVPEMDYLYCGKTIDI